MSKCVSSENNFSVSLGLIDYINPILYGITCFTIINNIDNIVSAPWNFLYVVGVMMSLLFGFMIPTIKLLVGLGKMEFTLPVNFVALVNTGLFLSGLMLLKGMLNINTLLFLGIILISIVVISNSYIKARRVNDVAIYIGAVGYFLIYISLIYRALFNSLYTPIGLYLMAICLYIMLICIGIKGNLKDARVHWVIEISNILCQLFVAIGTIILFY